MKYYIITLIGMIIFFIPILIIGLEKTREYRPTADKAIDAIFEELRKK